MFDVGDRVIWKPIDYRDHPEDKNHRCNGAIGTVIKVCRFDACIALDDFPNVNVWVNFEEIEQVK